MSRLSRANSDNMAIDVCLKECTVLRLWTCNNAEELQLEVMLLNSPIREENSSCLTIYILCL